MGFIKDLTDVPDIKISFDEPMKKHTSFGVGGTADFFIVCNSLFSLSLTVETFKRYKRKYKIIGNGTNLLVSDKGFRGGIIKFSVCDVYYSGDYIRAMAGANLKSLCEFCFTHGRVGVEGLYSIPATVGGAITMNASAFGTCISDYLVNVEVLDKGKLKKINYSDCNFSYRSSKFKNKRIPIIAGNFRFPVATDKDWQHKIKDFDEYRKKSFPLGKTCGSVFKNPNGDYAGRLIESSGLKGYRIGGAVVSDKHANFIVNTQNATAKDVDDLINHVKRTVKEEHFITLNEEVERLGDFT